MTMFCFEVRGQRIFFVLYVRRFFVLEKREMCCCLLSLAYVVIAGPSAQRHDHVMFPAVYIIGPINKRGLFGSFMT